MPKFVPVQGVIVHREGKSVVAPLDKPFDFTDAEVADILAMQPGAIREVIVESAPDAPVAAAGRRKAAASDL